MAVIKGHRSQATCHQHSPGTDETVTRLHSTARQSGPAADNHRRVSLRHLSPLPGVAGDSRHSCSAALPAVTCHRLLRCPRGRPTRGRRAAGGPARPAAARSGGAGSGAGRSAAPAGPGTCPHHPPAAQTVIRQAGTTHNRPPHTSTA